MSKIGLVTFSNNYDMQKYMYTLGEALLDSNYDIYTFGSDQCQHSFDHRRSFLFKVPGKPAIELRTFNLFELLKLYNKLARLDIVYFLSSHVWNLILIPLLKLKKIKIIHSIHDSSPHENEKNTKNVLVYNKCIAKYVDLIILHNTLDVNKFREKYTYEHRKQLMYVPLWHDWLQYQKLSHRKNILFFGRINPYKGVENIFSLAQELIQYNFYIVGKFSANCGEIKRKLDALSNVHIVDTYVDEKTMHEYFYNSSLVILPYNSATQSGVVIEAYRHSRPVIAFNVGAISEQVIEGRTGYLVPSGDLARMCNLIKEYFYMLPEQRNNMAMNAWNCGEKMYSPYSAIKYLEKALRMEN